MRYPSNLNDTIVLDSQSVSANHLDDQSVYCNQSRNSGPAPLWGKKNEHFGGWNGMFISRGEATGGGKLRQLFWELEMNRMGGKDTVFGAAWRRGAGGFAGAPERGLIGGLARMLIR